MIHLSDLMDYTINKKNKLTAFIIIRFVFNYDIKYELAFFCTKVKKCRLKIAIW